MLRNWETAKVFSVSYWFKSRLAAFADSRFGVLAPRQGEGSGQFGARWVMGCRSSGSLANFAADILGRERWEWNRAAA